jgi:uncharacterized lipoprotein YbaY
MRIGRSLWLVVLVLAQTRVAVAETPQDQPLRIEVKVAYQGLDALPWDSELHLYVTEVSSHGCVASNMVAEEKIGTKGEQIPISTVLTLPRAKLQRHHRYRICADITLPKGVRFRCDKAYLFSGAAPPRTVSLMLERVP